MNKKVMAVAVAAALAAPAAALAQVTVSGRFVAEYGFADQMDFAAGGSSGRESADGFNSPASNIRFSAEEKLGGGNSVWVQCENRARWGNDTSPTQSAGGFCDRNSALGFKGSYGNLFVGRWDTAIEDNSGLTRIAGSTGWDGRQHMLTEDQLGLISFAQRVQNSINYNSPTFGGGFAVNLSTTTTGTQLNTAATTAPNTGKDGRIWSILGKYASGPLVAYAGYEKHEDNQTVASGGLAGTEEEMFTLGVSYVFGPVKVGLVYTTFEGDNTTTTTVERDSWNIGVDWKISAAGTVRAVYSDAGEYEGSGALAASGFAGDTGAQQYSIGYYHDLSKRTRVGVYYTKVDNDTNGKYNYHSFNALVRPGESAGAFVLHAAHNF